MQAAISYPRPFGKYVLLRPLATGGMAEVFLAQMRGHAGFDKACVVKRVLPTHVTNKQYMEMFIDEARVIARLSHPNVIQVFDMGQVDDDYFMTMEYVPGADLQNLLDALPPDQRRLPIPVACRVIAQVAEGLDHAHRAVDGSGAPLGIVHRDVSPSNIIISVDGVAKICDFGIAKFGAQASKTEVGSLKGKIHYMSPEQVRGDKVDARADLFSLGAVLYEATLGVRPFEGQGPGDIALQIINDDPRPPDLYVDGFPQELWAVIQCLLAKRPADRFGSARELQVALDELLVAWKVRASSNEVAAYLERAMPGIGEQSRATSALAARPAEVGATPQPQKHSDAIAVGPTRQVRPFGSTQELSFGDDGAVPSPLPIDLSGPSLDGGDPRRDRRPRSSGAGFMAIVGIVLAVAAAFYWLTQRADHAAVPTVSPTPTPTVSPTPAPTPVVTALPTAEPPPAPKPPKPHPHPRAREEDPPRSLPRLPTPPPADETP